MPTFGLKVDGAKVDLTMKSISNRQFDYEFENMEYVKDDYTTVSAKGTHKLYNSQLFDYMSYFKCDFEIELRYAPNHDVLAVKAYAVANAPKDHSDEASMINILIGTQESKAKQISNQFEIFE